MFHFISRITNRLPEDCLLITKHLEIRYNHNIIQLLLDSLNHLEVLMIDTEDSTDEQVTEFQRILRSR